MFSLLSTTVLGSILDKDTIFIEETGPGVKLLKGTWVVKDEPSWKSI